MHRPLKGFPQNSHKIFSEDLCKIRQGPLRGFQQDLHIIRICTREDVTRIPTRPLGGFHQDHFVVACAVEMHMDMSQEAFFERIYRKTAALKVAPQTLCEPAQSKCTWTCHKSNFTKEFTGKMPEARWSTLIKHRPSPTVRTPQCGHTVWGRKHSRPAQV